MRTAAERECAQPLFPAAALRIYKRQLLAPARQAAAGRAAQSAQHILGRQPIEQLRISGFHDSRHSRRARSARRIQLLTVPRGLPVRRAISSWERPLTNAYSMQ